MSALEIVATALGIACVALAAVRSVWTFPVAIASVAALGVVVAGERLYSDALLQLFFVAANIYGWRQWSLAGGDSGEVRVERMMPRARLIWGGGAAAVALMWGGGMHRLTDAAWPWWDAAIAAGSVAAQLLMALRKLENWLLWIAVDLASIPLYLAKGLWLFAGLYLIYLVLACWGLWRWSRAEREGVEPAMAAA